MASAEHRKNMMLRWITQLKKTHKGRRVTRDIFLVSEFRPACFHDDPKKWAGEAFALCVKKKIMSPVDEKRGVWEFVNIHDVPIFESADVLDTSTFTPSVCASEEVPLDRAHDYGSSNEENSEMVGEHTQSQVTELMTEERFKALAGVSKMLLRILKSIYLLVGPGVFRYSELRPSQHGYRHDEKDRSAFTQMIVKARSLGIIVGTDEQGNLYTGPRGLGYGKFVPHMVPIEWSVNLGASLVDEEEASSKPTEPIVEHPSSADLPVPLPTTQTLSQALPATAMHEEKQMAPRVSDSVELEQLRLENAALKGQIVAYQEIIGQLISKFRSG